MTRVPVTALTTGTAEGAVLALDEPLSFWGGLAPETGEIIDRWHPQSGTILSRTMLMMWSGRGSSSGSTVLAEAIRLGTAPAAILLVEPDPIIAVGVLVAEELYGLACPLVLLDSADYQRLRSAPTLRLVQNAEQSWLETSIF